jgi:chromosome segregation ATPase
MLRYLRLPRAAQQPKQGGFDDIVLRQGADAVHRKKRAGVLRIVDEQASTQISRARHSYDQCVIEVQDTQKNLEDLQKEKKRLELIISRFPDFREKSTKKQEKLYQDVERVNEEVEIEETKLTELRQSLVTMGLFDPESLLDQILQAIERDPSMSKDGDSEKEEVYQDPHAAEFEGMSRLWAEELSGERPPAQDPEYDILPRSELLKEAEQARETYGELGQALSQELGATFYLLPNPAGCVFHEAAALIHGPSAALDLVRGSL